MLCVVCCVLRGVGMGHSAWSRGFRFWGIEKGVGGCGEIELDGALRLKSALLEERFACGVLVGSVRLFSSVSVTRKRRRSRSASACAACAPRVDYCDLGFACPVK